MDRGLVTGLALLFVRGLSALVGGDLDKLFALIGSKSAVAEAQEEVVNVEKAFAQERQERQDRTP